jgi:nitroreductase
MDRRLEIGSWLDYGMFLQNLMIAARAHGLETCAQAAFAPFHQTVRRYVPIPDSEILLCGMSLGYEDTTAPENRLRTERSPATEFAQFLGWDDNAG